MRSLWKTPGQRAGLFSIEAPHMEMVNQPPPERGNRLCVCGWDISLQCFY